MSFGILSLLPPLIAIGLALWTRQVFLSLIVGIWCGYLILSGGNPFTASLAAMDAQITVLTDAGNARLVIFTVLMGALIALMQRGGGVEGFITRILNFLEKSATMPDEINSFKPDTFKPDIKRRKKLELIAMATGLVLFIESNISILTVGTLYRPIFDRLNIPREKLAYIADSTCAPSCILMPFNAWGAFIMGLLLAQNVENPFGLLIGSIAYNFYPLLTLALLFFVIVSGRDIGEMKQAETRAKATGAVLRPGAVPMMDDSLTMLVAKTGKPARARNMLIPVAVLVFLMPSFLIMTGWGDASGVGFAKITNALAQGSGSKAVLYAVSFSVLTAMVLLKIQKILGVREMIDLSLRGMSGMLSIALLTVLAFALNALCKEMGTGHYMAELARQFISPAFVPAIVFILAAAIAFSTGTSWGTFAIMIAMAVPLARELDLNLSLVVAASLGGGIFGDHCSPTSDTSLITSMATANDHIDHVRTQLPYALIAGAGSIILYVVLGFAQI